MSVERVMHACDRLEGAVTRLERAAESAIPADMAGGGGDLRMARARNTALSAVAGNVADRLDQVIEQLQTLLGDEQPDGD